MSMKPGMDVDFPMSMYRNGCGFSDEYVSD